ncbi:hypothetical protein NUH87_28400 [Pseudomonas batumici]|uniref:hypothetical protein n=1 Tax=Pseudomonas batumici TaxID=226910 RepID=UPI0030CC59F3
MVIDGVEYRFEIASSVTPRHDGLAIECWKGNDMVFEVFRNDQKLKFEVTLFMQGVPLELLEEIIPSARARLGEFVQ